MKAVLILLACLATLSAAKAHELVTPPLFPHPMPQGVPYFIEGAEPHAVITLGFAIVNGRRVLFNQATGRIVYVLRP